MCLSVYQHIRSTLTPPQSSQRAHLWGPGDGVPARQMCRLLRAGEPPTVTGSGEYGRSGLGEPVC